MLKLVLAASAAVSIVMLAGGASAATTYTDLATWQAAVGTSTETTQFGLEDTDINSATLADGTTVGFDTALTATSIGDEWATWSGGYTGQVLVDENTSLIMTPSSTNGLGFFIEPEDFDDYTFTLTLSDGSTTSATYNGESGAGFLGFAGSDVSSLTVATDDVNGFAVGDFYSAKGTVSAAPEPGTWALMFGGLAMIGGMLRIANARRRENEVAGIATA